MAILLGVGFLFGALFVTFMGRSILAPVRALMQSARDIEKGNLDLVVQVQSSDELGQLAEAFNSMAARLREFRRTDRATRGQVLHGRRDVLDEHPGPAGARVIVQRGDQLEYPRSDPSPGLHSQPKYL